MVEITYKNGNTDIFEIYHESKTFILYKDKANNIIKLNKINNLTYIYIDNLVKEIDLNIVSFRKIN